MRPWLFAGGRGGRSKDGSGELNTPDRAALIELALFSDECGRVTAEDPDVDVGELLADNRSDEAGDAAELDLDSVVGGLVAEAANDESIFAFPDDEEMNQTRLFGGRNHGETGWRGRGVKIQQQGERKSVRDVGGKVEMVLGGLAVFVARGDLASSGVDDGC